MKWIKKILRWFSNTFDIEDFFTLIALSLIFYGFYLYKPFFSYIITGFILLIIVINGKRTKGKT